MYKQGTSFNFNLKAHLWPAAIAVINVFNNYYLRFCWVFNNKALTCVYSFLTSDLPELYRFWFAGFIIFAGRDCYLYNAQVDALHSLDTRMEMLHSFPLVYSSFSTAGQMHCCGFLPCHSNARRDTQKTKRRRLKGSRHKKGLGPKTCSKPSCQCDICSE